MDWDRFTKLFLSYRAGDGAATRELFLGLEKSLSGFFFARTRSEQESEELTQAALLKIHFNRERFDSERSLKTWVFTLAGRILIDHWRGDSSGVEESIEELMESGDSAPLASSDLDPERKVELTRDLNRALETLKPKDRLIVYLYGVEGFSMAEIAETLGLTESAVKVRAHRSYQQLRQAANK